MLRFNCEANKCNNSCSCCVCVVNLRISSKQDNLNQEVQDSLHYLRQREQDILNSNKNLVDMLNVEREAHQKDTRALHNKIQAFDNRLLVPTTQDMSIQAAQASIAALETQLKDANMRIKKLGQRFLSVNRQYKIEKQVQAAKLSIAERSLNLNIETQMTHETKVHELQVLHEQALLKLRQELTMQFEEKMRNNDIKINTKTSEQKSQYFVQLEQQRAIQKLEHESLLLEIKQQNSRIVDNLNAKVSFLELENAKLMQMNTNLKENRKENEVRMDKIKESERMEHLAQVVEKSTDKIIMLTNKKDSGDIENNRHLEIELLKKTRAIEEVESIRHLLENDVKHQLAANEMAALSKLNIEQVQQQHLALERERLMQQDRDHHHEVLQWKENRIRLVADIQTQIVQMKTLSSKLVQEELAALQSRNELKLQRDIVDRNNSIYQENVKQLNVLESKLRAKKQLTDECQDRNENERRDNMDAHRRMKDLREALEKTAAELQSDRASHTVREQELIDRMDAFQQQFTKETDILRHSEHELRELKLQHALDLERFEYAKEHEKQRMSEQMANINLEQAGLERKKLQLQDEQEHINKQMTELNASTRRAEHLLAANRQDMHLEDSQLRAALDESRNTIALKMQANEAEHQRQYRDFQIMKNKWAEQYMLEKADIELMRKQLVLDKNVVIEIKTKLSLDISKLENSQKQVNDSQMQLRLERQKLEQDVHALEQRRNDDRLERDRAVLQERNRHEDQEKKIRSRMDEIHALEKELRNREEDLEHEKQTNEDIFRERESELQAENRATIEQIADLEVKRQDLLILSERVQQQTNQVGIMHSALEEEKSIIRQKKHVLQQSAENQLNQSMKEKDAQLNQSMNEKDALNKALLIERKNTDTWVREVLRANRVDALTAKALRPFVDADLHSYDISSGKLSSQDENLSTGPSTITKSNSNGDFHEISIHLSNSMSDDEGESQEKENEQSL